MAVFRTEYRLDVFMKRIVLLVGGVETLAYFSIQMGNEWKRMGYKVFYFDLEDEMNSAKKLRRFIKPGETVLVTFNFEGLEKEAGVYREGIGYVWDEYAVPCYNIAVDHPYYYHERLADLPEKYYHISIDRLHEDYFKHFYPEFTHRGFLPLAGSSLEELCKSNSGKEDGKQSVEYPAEANRKPVEKKYNVIMTGNFTPTSFCEPYIHWINDEYAAFYQGIIDDVIAHPHRTVEEVALEHCEREMGENTYKDLRMALHRMIFIDIYVRNYWRREAVKVLVDSGIQVDVFGKGWDELTCGHPENMILHPQTTSEECLKAIAASKISLNVMPWFKDGAHDRVFNSILNGTVSVTDTSKYLCGELKEGQGVCYYDLAHMEKLPELVRDLLADDARREEIVRAGIPVVEEKHTWIRRAHQLLEWIEEDARGTDRKD